MLSSGLSKKIDRSGLINPFIAMMSLENDQ